MTPAWRLATVAEYSDQIAEIAATAEERLDGITSGRVAPAIDEIRIGSGRKMRAAVLFFDIRGFTQRTDSADMQSLKRTLFMLNCVIPMMMSVLYRHGAFVEKNTGDGLMAILGAEEDDAGAANTALSAAAEMFYVLHNVVNPVLSQAGIPSVDARIGMDLGTLLISRIGLPTGTSRHSRNTLTAVGPSANIACKVQGLAGTNQIWCGDLIKVHAEAWRQELFRERTPLDWQWIYSGTENRYSIWHYDASRRAPTR